MRKLRALWSVVLGLAALVVLTQPAHAGSITLTGSSPVDASLAPPRDLTSGKMAYDAAAGRITLSVQTVESNAGVKPTMVYALLAQTTQAGQCIPADSEDGPPVALISLSWIPEGDAQKWVLNSPITVGDVDVTRSGSSLTATAKEDVLANLTFDCAQVQTWTQIPGADGSPEDVAVDVMNIFTPEALLKVVPPPVVTTEPDKDKDGVPDAKDKCPTVPGAKADGCLTISAKLAIRLGAKRVAIDKIVARTSGNVCPLKASVKVTMKKGKKNVTIGKGVVSVSTHGSYCRAYGVVKLKKTAKVAKITVKAKGMGSIAATRKRGK